MMEVASMGDSFHESWGGLQFLWLHGWLYHLSGTVYEPKTNIFLYVYQCMNLIDLQFQMKRHPTFYRILTTLQPISNLGSNIL